MYLLVYEIPNLSEEIKKETKGMAWFISIFYTE